MLVEFGKANLLNKARQQPDKVRMVLDKVKTDGLMPTIASVRNKLDQPLTWGTATLVWLVREHIYPLSHVRNPKSQLSHLLQLLRKLGYRSAGISLHFHLLRASVTTIIDA
jgi:hypothetical protein